MKITNLHSDVYSGIILTLTGIYFYSEANKLNEQAGIFPKIALGIFIILAIIMIIEGLKKSKKNISENNKENKNITLNQIKVPLIMFLFITAYVIGLEFIGFYISTLIFIPAIILFYRNRKVIMIIGSTLGTIIFLHFLIVVQLKLLLP